MQGYADCVAKYACPCCGYLTLDQEPPGTFRATLLGTRRVARSEAELAELERSIADVILACRKGASVMALGDIVSHGRDI
jgi:hypothetical protein